MYKIAHIADTHIRNLKFHYVLPNQEFLNDYA